MPVNNLIEFLLYIIPGFVALQQYRAVYPARQLSRLGEIAWSAIYGLIAVLFVTWTDRLLFSNALRSDTQGITEPRFVLSLLVVGWLVGWCRAGVDAARFKLVEKFPKLSFFQPDLKSIWVRINQPNDNWAVVFLTDGAIYLGWVSHYRSDPDQEDQDFLLSDARRVDETLNTKYIVDGQGVYINTKNINRIEFIKGQTESGRE